MFYTLEVVDLVVAAVVVSVVKIVVVVVVAILFYKTKSGPLKYSCQSFVSLSARNRLE